MGQLFEDAPLILQFDLPLGGMNININQCGINVEHDNRNGKVALGKKSVIAPLQGIAQGKALDGPPVDEKELGGTVGPGKPCPGNYPRMLMPP